MVEGLPVDCTPNPGTEPLKVTSGSFCVPNKVSQKVSQHAFDGRSLVCTNTTVAKLAYAFNSPRKQMVWNKTWKLSNSILLNFYPRKHQKNCVTDVSQYFLLVTSERMLKTIESSKLNTIKLLCVMTFKRHLKYIERTFNKDLIRMIYFDLEYYKEILKNYQKVLSSLLLISLKILSHRPPKYHCKINSQ